MIQIKNLSKSYSGNSVYEDFNLEIEEGKITCILGESGSGKTTLLNCMANLTEYSGEISKLKCAYIFQTPRLVPNLTVFGNLALICKDKERITEMLKRVHLENIAKSYPISLSGGQAQRVAIARAFLYGGDIILMDEPFSSLDLKIKREMTELFFEIWREEKRTAMFVTHDIDEAVSVAERVIVLKNGKIAYDYTPISPVPRVLGSAESFRQNLIAAVME